MWDKKELNIIPDIKSQSKSEYNKLMLIDKIDWCLCVYYESRKRKLKTRLIYEYRCDERLKN